MKLFDKLALAACLVASCAMAWGQSGAGIPQPSFHWQCVTGDSSLNHHPATTMPLSFDSIPFAEDYTMVVVYKPIADTEAVVWRLTFSDSLVRGLTTKRIISDNTNIQYEGTSDQEPVIHTIQQSAPDTASARVRLLVGDGGIMVTEVLYYDHRIGRTALRRIQSALAVRYGITLGPVDYVGSDGKPVWKHKCDSARYHHHIFGVGQDSASSLCQLQSHSESRGGIAAISTDSLNQGSYLLVGDNNAPLSFDQGEEGVETLSRAWMAQAADVRGRAFSFAFDIRDLPGPVDSLVLIMDGTIMLPAAVSANEVRFDNICFASASSMLTLARGSVLWQRARDGAKGTKGDKSGGGAPVGSHGERSQYCHMYPNPTAGHFNIEVTGARQVQIAIYNLQGKVMATFSDSDHDSCSFESSLPPGNVYYATVTTENGSQTMKLVVK